MNSRQIAEALALPGQRIVALDDKPPRARHCVRAAKFEHEFRGAGELVRASAGAPSNGGGDVASLATRSQPRQRLTDAGNSLRFSEDHAQHLRYAAGPGWYVWDGKRWRRDNESAPYRAAKETAHRIRAEAAQQQDPKVFAQVAAWAVKSESRERLKAMVDLASRGERDTRGLLIDVAELDARPNLLTCANGTVNLRTGRVRRHRREDYLTRLVDVPYDSQATAPRWQAFLDEVFGDDALIGYVQRAVGYSLTGETSEQVFFLAHGAGANGKTVFIETVAAIAGEYALTAAADTFVSSMRGSSIPSDLARMRGGRLVRVPETEDGARLARQVVKRITGGDEITARFMHRDCFTFTPTFKVWLVTNHLPSLPVTDTAAWRRIRVVPFTKTVPPRQRDPQLAARLRAELPGILAWAVEGACAWYELGSLGEPPESITQALTDYRASQDTVGRFLNEELEDDPTAQVLKTELYAAYEQWCASERLRVSSPKAFFGALRERGYTEAKIGRGERVMRGIRFS